MFKALFYTTYSGARPVEKFLNEQDEKARAKIMKAIQRLKELGYRLIRPEAAKIKDRLYELRVEFSPNNYRIIYFFYAGQYVVLTHAFKKKSQELKLNDIKTAEDRMKDFETRVIKGELVL